MNILTIIPARSGSKGVKNKNKNKIDGVPLIQYTIEVALNSLLKASVWVSTDDRDIKDICDNYDELNIHHRKSINASDTSPVTDTLREVLLLAESQSAKVYDTILLLQPTAPLRTLENIKEAIDLLYKNNSTNSVVSVCAMDDIHPARMYWKEKDELKPILPEYEQHRRQDIPLAYYRNGCIYLVKRAAFLKHNQIMAKPLVPYIMPTSLLLNIDEPRDILIAEALIPVWKRGEL